MEDRRAVAERLYYSLSQEQRDDLCFIFSIGVEDGLVEAMVGFELTDNEDYDLIMRTMTMAMTMGTMTQRKKLTVEKKKLETMGTAKGIRKATQGAMRMEKGKIHEIRSGL